MSEYPLNEQNQYPLIRKCVERMFASRTKPMSEKTIEIWVEEIITRNVSDIAIKKATNEFIEEEEYNLSLPVVLKLIYKNFMCLAVNKYGNYLIQFLLEKWRNIPEGKAIKQLIINHFKLLHKSSKTIIFVL